jgi:hypothetical protein
LQATGDDQRTAQAASATGLEATFFEFTNKFSPKSA